MAQFSEGIPPVSSFPNDDKQRVVWAHGAVYQNRSHATGLPLVDILLRNINNDGSLDEKSRVSKIAVPQLDTVRFGTIWQGQRRTTSVWSDYGGEYRENVKFIFDFELNSPESIMFSEKYPNTENKYYIPPFIYSLGRIENKADYRKCMNSTYTKMTTPDNQTVLIPSMELFTSTYTPEEQQIRNMLLMNPMDDIVNKYLYSYRISGYEYIVDFKRKKSRSNMVFLSYLALNRQSRISVNKLRSSILVERMNAYTGKVYPDKYPVVLPYHPEKLSLMVDGIQIDENVFLVLRIKKYSLPAEYIINTTVPDEENHSEKKDDRGNSVERRLPRRELEDGSDIPIVKDVNPHVDAGVFKNHSEVEYMDGGLVLTCKINNSSHASGENISHRDGEQNEINALSSGDANSQKSSEGTAAIEIQEDLRQETKEIIKNSLVIQDTVDALSMLVKDTSFCLHNVEYIDQNGIVYEDPVMSSFAGMGKSNWFFFEIKESDILQTKKKYRPRGCLIAKVTLIGGKYAYLLEIEKKSNDESFRGLIFNTLTGNLDGQTIKEILLKISLNRGRYVSYIDTGETDSKGKKLKDCIDLDIYVSSRYIYTHKTIQGSFANKMKNVIMASKRADIFI